MKSTLPRIIFRVSVLVGLPLMLQLSASAFQASGTNQKKVLALIPARRDAPAAVLVDRAYQKVFSDSLGGRVDYYSEYLDQMRFSEPEYQRAFFDFLSKTYKDKKIDLVLSFSPFSNAFV